MLFYRTMFVTLLSLTLANPAMANNLTSIQQPQTDVNHKASVSAPKTITQKEEPSRLLKMNINEASEKELIRVRGLNASKAKAIVRYRKKHGDFKELDTLAKVRGFTRMKEEDLKSIKDQLSVN